MVKPARLGSSVGMTLAHTAGRARRGARARLPLRRPGDRRALPRQRPRPRGLGDRLGARSRPTGRARSWPATSSTTTRRSTRRACPRRRPGPRSRTRPRELMKKLARDAYRALGTEGFARVDFLVRERRRSTSRRSTRSRASRRSACSRRCRPRRASTSRRSACGSSTSRWRGTRRARAAATDAGGPAAVKGFGGRRRGQGARRMKPAKPIARPDRRMPRSGARPRPRGRHAGRRTRHVRPRAGRAARLPGLAASAAAAGEQGRACAAALGRLVTPARAAGLLAHARRGLPPDLRHRPERLRPDADGHSVAPLDRRDGPSARRSRCRRAQTSSSSTPRRSRRPRGAARRRATPRSTVSLPGRRARRDRSAEREAILAWEAGDTRFLADREGVDLRDRREATPSCPPTLPVVEDRRAARADGLAIGARLDPVDLDVATRLGSLAPGRRRECRVAPPRPRDRRRRLPRLRRRRAGPRSSASTARPPRADASSRARSGLLRSFLAGPRGRQRRRRVILASETNGTYIPKADAPADQEVTEA